MNPGICYLYEYENNQRKRNVGFLKIARHYQSCVLQIHARGIRAGNGAALELYAFYLDDGRMIANQIASLTCFAHMISIRLPVTESHFPEGRSLQQIDGFLLRFPANGMPVFWMASNTFFDVDLSKLQPPEEAAAPDNAAADDTTFTDSETTPDDTLPSDNEPSPEANISSDNSVTTDTSANETENAELSEHPISTEEETCAAQQDRSSHGAHSASSPSARKITRRDISLLPRKYWFLANNSFLLHGYHNYGHLLLVEEKGHLWLGVPGIYDPREARAADLFGFPQFTREYAPLLDLSEDERNDSADFGHWCRYISQRESGTDDSLPHTPK